MMSYSPEELSGNARILWILTTVVMVLYTLAGLIASLAVVAYGAQRGAPQEMLWVLGGVTFIVFGIVGLVILAPMRLIIEAALCLSRIEQHLAAQSGSLGAVRDHLTAVEALPVLADR